MTARYRDPARLAREAMQKGVSEVSMEGRRRGRREWSDQRNDEGAVSGQPRATRERGDATEPRRCAERFGLRQSHAALSCAGFPPRRTAGQASDTEHAIRAMRGKSG